MLIYDESLIPEMRLRVEYLGGGGNSEEHKITLVAENQPFTVNGQEKEKVEFVVNGEREFKEMLRMFSELYSPNKPYLQIKTAKLVKSERGHNIEISKIGLYDENGKRIKRVKLNDTTIEELKKGNIPLSFNINSNDDYKSQKP